MINNTNITSSAAQQAIYEVLTAALPNQKVRIADIVNNSNITFLTSAHAKYFDPKNTSTGKLKKFFKDFLCELYGSNKTYGQIIVRKKIGVGKKVLSDRQMKNFICTNILQIGAALFPTVNPVKPQVKQWRGKKGKNVKSNVSQQDLKKRRIRKGKKKKLAKDRKLHHLFNATSHYEAGRDVDLNYCLYLTFDKSNNATIQETALFLYNALRYPSGKRKLVDQLAAVAYPCDPNSCRMILLARNKAEKNDIEQILRRMQNRFRNLVFQDAAKQSRNFRNLFNDLDQCVQHASPSTKLVYDPITLPMDQSCWTPGKKDSFLATAFYRMDRIRDLADKFQLV